MEIPHIIFNNGKIETKKDNPINPVITTQLTPEQLKAENEAIKKIDNFEEKVRKYTMIGLLILVGLYGSFRIIKVLFFG